MIRNEKDLIKEIKLDEKDKNSIAPTVPTKIEIQNFNLPEMPMISIISGFKYYTNIIEINLSGNSLSPKSCFWLGSVNKTNPNLPQKKSGVKKIRNANNFSSCFESMKNLEEYKNNLKSYTKEKRTEKKAFKPKNIINETPAERYYKEMYENNGSNILPERCFSADKYTKEKYADRKKNWKNEDNKLNDEISELKLKPKINKKIYVKVKNKWTDDNSGNYHFIDNKQNPVNNARINKQIYLQSNLFKNEDEKNDESLNEKKRMKTLEQINSRIEKEKNRKYRNERYHFSPQERKRDLSGNDRMIYGAVHSKWEKSKIDWLNPQTELMFGTQASKDLKKEFGPKGPNAFQRKMNQLADSKNIDIINENQKIPINTISKPNGPEVANDKGNKKWEEIVEKIPNLSPDKKLKIRQNATNSILNDENNFENKAKTLTNFYSNPNMENITKKSKKEVTDKIGKKKSINNTNKKPEKKRASAEKRKPLTKTPRETIVIIWRRKASLGPPCRQPLRRAGEWGRGGESRGKQEDLRAVGAAAVAALRLRRRAGARPAPCGDAPRFAQPFALAHAEAHASAHPQPRAGDRHSGPAEKRQPARRPAAHGVCLLHQREHPGPDLSGHRSFPHQQHLLCLRFCLPLRLSDQGHLVLRLL